MDDAFGVPAAADPFGVPAADPMAAPAPMPDNAFSVPPAAPTADNEEDEEGKGGNDDAFGAIPVATDAPMGVVDENAKIKEFEAKFAAEMAKKEEAERAKAQELKDEAEQWLDSWHDKKTDEKVEKAATNRKEEAEGLEMREELLKAATEDNPYKRVYDLIGAKDKADEEDTARMYGLVVSLKSKGAKILQK